MDGHEKAGSENHGNRFDFENLLRDNRTAVERFVRFRLPSRADAEDVLQEVYLTAYERFGDLKNQEAFLAWIISIARNKCSDYFREMARRLEMPFAALPENVGGLSACSDEPPGQSLTDSGVGLQESDLIGSRHGLVMPGRFGDPGDTSEADAVRETLELLRDKDRQILYLYFWKELPQAEIARRLGVPLGTVKSRLFTAKQKFKEQYPPGSGTFGEGHPPGSGMAREKHSYRTGARKGESNMTAGSKMAEEKITGRTNGKVKLLPEYLPAYRIEASGEAPFSVKWEELMGWFLVPKLGEKLTWGMYDMPSRRCDYVYDMEVTGRAMVHGIEGMEVTAKEMLWENSPEEAPRQESGSPGMSGAAGESRSRSVLSLPGPEDTTRRVFVAQLTDTHCRYLATLRYDGDVRNYITFLDGDAFMNNWGFGEDNCGNETNLSPKGDITRVGNVITSVRKDFLLDIVGRYTVTIGEKTYDTVCVMDIETYNSGVVSEQFLDANGRTILWRRFNRNDWAFDRYHKKWTELLPENDRLIVNGVPYVQWYDCVTDYIFRILRRAK